MNDKPEAPTPLEALNNLWDGQKTTENYVIIYNALSKIESLEKACDFLIETRNSEAIDEAFETHKANKLLKAFRKICNNLNNYEFTDEYRENRNLIENALKRNIELEKGIRTLEKKCNRYQKSLFALMKKKIDLYDLTLANDFENIPNDFYILLIEHHKEIEIIKESLNRNTLIIANNGIKNTINIQCELNVKTQDEYELLRKEIER